MNWGAAVLAMRKGYVVRRRPHVVETSEIDGMTVVFRESDEGIRLMYAWTVDEKPTLIFMGAESKQFFIPSSEDQKATDWAIVT